MFRYAFDALYAVALCLLPFAATAAGVTLGDSIGSITLRDWLIVLVLSAVAGMVALLKRLKDEAAAYEDRVAALPDGATPPAGPNWGLFVLVHMASAVASGIVSFLACESLDVEDFKEALVIAVSAWTGAKVLDVCSAALIGTIGTIAAVASTAPPATPEKE